MLPAPQLWAISEPSCHLCGYLRALVHVFSTLGNLTAAARSERFRCLLALHSGQSQLKIRAFPPYLRDLVNIFQSGQSQSPSTRAVALLPTVGNLRAKLPSVWLSQSPGPCVFHSGQSVSCRSAVRALGLSYRSPLWAISVKNSSLPTLSQSPSPYFHLWRISEPLYKGLSPAPQLWAISETYSGQSQSSGQCFPLWAICLLALGPIAGAIL